MIFRVVFAFAFLMMGTGLQAAPNVYAAGQVWEYRTRTADTGSLLKIQQVDVDPRRAEHRTIYHISIINVRLNDPTVRREISHVPVSREALDDSVTRLSSSRLPFPDARDGITEWRRSNGGVFTIPIARIIDVVEKTMRSMPTAQR
jgi:hypothetical protein